MPPGVFKLLTSLLRTANNILGGISFVTLAKITGVQSSAGMQSSKTRLPLEDPDRLSYRGGSTKQSFRGDTELPSG